MSEHDRGNQPGTPMGGFESLGRSESQLCFDQGASRPVQLGT